MNPREASSTPGLAQSPAGRAQCPEEWAASTAPMLHESPKSLLGILSSSCPCFVFTIWHESPRTACGSWDGGEGIHVTRQQVRLSITQNAGSPPHGPSSQ